jgi:hypothetical protein
MPLVMAQRIKMQRLKNYTISSLSIALLLFPSTTSSQKQEHPPKFSPVKTSRPEHPEGSLNQATKFVKHKKSIPNRYIVVLNDDVISDNAPLEVRRARITAIANSHAKTYRGKVDYIYETALKGYAINLPNEAAAIAISHLPQVKWVEEDALGELDQPAAVKSVELPSSSNETGSVCRGKPVAVSPLKPKLSGRRMSFVNGGITERARLVIRDHDEFGKLWKEIYRLSSDKPPLPEVDFSREMLIVAAMGQQPSSGYEIIIDGACALDNQLEVSVRSTNFLKCGLQLGILTAPVDIVRLPKTDLPVVFRETEVTSDCKELLRP